MPFPASGPAINLNGLAGVAGRYFATKYLRSPRRRKLYQHLPRIFSAFDDYKYLRYDAGFFGRTRSVDGVLVTGNEWADDNERPIGFKIPHTVQSGRTKRVSENYRFGLRSIRNNPDALQTHGLDAVNRLYLTHLGRFESEVVGSGTPIPFSTMAGLSDVGGNITQATAANNYIAKMFDEAKRDIVQASAGSATMDDIVAVMGLQTYQQIKRSPEVLAYRQGQTEGSQALRDGDLSRLFETDIVVHDEVFNLTADGEATSLVQRYPFQGLGTQGSNAVKDAILFYVAPRDRRIESVGEDGLPSALNAGDQALAVNDSPNLAIGEVYTSAMEVAAEEKPFDQIVLGGVHSEISYEIFAPELCKLVGSVLG